MGSIVDDPLAVLAASLVPQLVGAYLGDIVRQTRKPDVGAVREDFGTILPAVLTLLGLLVGFSFSMTVSRFDPRKNFEEAEANAIGTAYVRADLLAAAE